MLARTPVQPKLKLSSGDKLCKQPLYHSLDPRANKPLTNDVGKGIINTSKNKANASYTILLLGATGVGKSTFVELIANVIHGREADDYNFDILDSTIEQGGPGNQSHTSLSRLYEFTSKSGKVVRLLDTPGLIDTRDIQQDERHKESVAAQIKNHVSSVNAVLVLANGTVPRGTGSVSTALSALSTIFPKTLANNVAFMFTNIESPLSWNFRQDSLPGDLKDAPQFHLDNPIALQKKYLKLKDDPKMKETETKMREEVKVAEQNALEMLVGLFDWLDGLKPQTTTKVTPDHDKSEKPEAKVADPLAPTEQAAVKKKAKKFALFTWVANRLSS